MRIGVPKEVKNHEYRVAITPIGVHELVAHGHEVHVEKRRPASARRSTTRSTSLRARRSSTPPTTVWGDAEMVLKVKEPVAEEYHRMREGLVLFTYLHLAADQPLTEELLERKVTGIAYETVQLPSGALPLLYPMSEVAGCLAPQVGAYSLMKAQGGRGVLMGGVGGVANAKVVDHRRRCLGPERRQHRARHGRRRHPARHRPRQAADVVLALQQPGARAGVVQAGDRAAGARGRPGHRRRADPRCQGAEAGQQRAGLPDEAGLGARRHRRRPGRLLRGHPRDHARRPDVPVHNSVFYCVANMPGAVPNTSTYALTNATLPYTVALADKGWQQACRDDHSLALGLNTHDGQLTNAPGAHAHDLEAADLDAALA